MAEHAAHAGTLPILLHLAPARISGNSSKQRNRRTRPWACAGAGSQASSRHDLIRAADRAHDVSDELPSRRSAACWSRSRTAACVGVRGDPDNPDSQGFLCVRGQASHEIIGNPARLLHPAGPRAARRTTGGEASWDEALDLIAERMRAVGRRARSASGRATGWRPPTTARGCPAHLARRFANLWGCQSWSAHDDLLGPRRLRPRRSPAS